MPHDLKLLHAFKEGDTSKLEELLNELVIDINSLDDGGYSLLHYAAEYDQPEAIRLLVEKGADVNCKGMFNRTPLHCASDCKNPKSVETLIELKANINLQNLIDGIPGETPLLALVEALPIAINEGNEKNALACIYLLIKANPDLSIQNHNGTKVLELAMHQQHTELAIALLQYYLFSQQNKQETTKNSLVCLADLDKEQQIKYADLIIHLPIITQSRIAEENLYFISVDQNMINKVDEENIALTPVLGFHKYSCYTAQECFHDDDSLYFTIYSENSLQQGAISLEMLECFAECLLRDDKRRDELLDFTRLLMEIKAIIPNDSSEVAKSRFSKIVAALDDVAQRYKSNVVSSDPIPTDLDVILPGNANPGADMQQLYTRLSQQLRFCLLAPPSETNPNTIEKSRYDHSPKPI